MEEHLTIILTEMCKRVGADIDIIDFKGPDWYIQHEWTEEQQEDFSNWMVDYLYNNKKARKEMLRFEMKDKKRLKEAVDWFILDYGWKIKRGE